MNDTERDAILLNIQTRLSALETFVSDLGERVPRSDHARIQRLDGKPAGYTCACGEYIGPKTIHGCAKTGW